MSGTEVPDTRLWPCAVVGAGAAGLLAGISAGCAGVACVVLETREKPGAKIRVSGGGRCNVLPSRAELDDFHTSGSRNAMRNLLASWPLEEVRAFFERDLALPLVVEETGKIFPASNDPKEVVLGLLAELARAGGSLIGGFRVQRVERAGAGDGAHFALASDDGRAVRARTVVLATGGLSLPKTGSDGHGYEIARSLGHSLAPTYPALVPLLASASELAELAGLSLRAELRAERGGNVLEQREDDFLFTHKGFSGPVVLDLSYHHAKPGGADVRYFARWIGRTRPDWDNCLRQGGKKSVGGLLREELPRRLADLGLSRAGVAADTKASELARDGRLRLVRELDAFELAVVGDEGYRTAEVTGGGVPLAEVATRTLESRLVPGLFFAGEMLDVTGRIGGFNFLWAWVSGRLAGSSAARAACDKARGSRL